MLVSEWLEEWLENYIKSTMKDKTFETYKAIVEKHLIPVWGDYDMKMIKPIDAQKYITALLKSGNLLTGEGLSPSSINMIITVIQGAFKTAHLLGITDRYDMDKIKRPKIKDSTVQCFSKVEQKRIEEAILKDKRMKMRGVILCLYTGLRIGELLALKWDDIDFKNQELSVRRACHDGKNAAGQYCRITDSPKTATSVRQIPIPKKIMPILREMKKATTSEYVVAGEKTYIMVRSYQRSFQLLLKKLEIPNRGFHSLRHTFATRALECGMDVKTLSEILGHKNPMVTLQRYVHSMPDHKKVMMDRVGSLF